MNNRSKIDPFNYPARVVFQRLINGTHRSVRNQLAQRRISSRSSVSDGAGGGCFNTCAPVLGSGELPPLNHLSSKF
jgi:hypothetical protein